MGLDPKSRLTAQFRKGVAEDLQGTVFEEPLDLAGAVLPNLDLRRAVFKRPVNLRNARFLGLAWFQGAVFESSLNLAGAEFGNDARFDDAEFRQGATFSRVMFSGIPCFDRTVFRDVAFLDGMFCSGSLSLLQTRLEASGTLRDTECFGGVWGDGMYVRTPLETRGLRVYGRCLLPSAVATKDRTSVRQISSAGSRAGGVTKRV